MAGSILKHFGPIEDNIRGKLPEYLKASGFNDVKETDSANTLFGTVSFYYGATCTPDLPRLSPGAF
jgi:hypothetical protein